MVITSRLSDDKLLKAIYRSAEEYSKLIGKSYLFIGKNKNSSYYWFQCHFEKKYFMHLLGINSKRMSADDFYEECDKYNRGEGEGISVFDCIPAYNHSRTTINEKCSCCADMLRIQDAKYMKIGKKDKISEYVDFTYAYGSVATLGFKRINNTSFPISLIPKNIDSFASSKYKIIIVLSKETGQQEKYSDLFF